jgi:hypothetical protein
MQPANKILLPIVTCILVIAVACEKAPEPPKSITFKANCFITTKGSDNIKMGGVEVVFLDGEMIEFSKLHQTYTNVFEPAQKALNDFAGWNVWSNDSENKSETNKNEQIISDPDLSQEGPSEDLEAKNRIFNIAEYIAWEQIKKEYNNIPLDLIKITDEQFAEHKEIAEEYIQLEKGANYICSYNNQLDLIFSQISDYEIKRERTDADGKLEIKLPEKKSYVIIAKSQRMVVSEDSPENYFWILRAENQNSDNELEPEIKLQLSNYNLSNLNEENPEETTEERLMLKAPEVMSMAGGIALLKKEQFLSLLEEEGYLD